MKKLIVTACLVVTANMAFAAITPQDTQKWTSEHLRLFGSFDYFSVGNFNKAFEDDVSAAAQAAAQAGFNASGKTTTKPGIGGRIGEMVLIRDGYAIGGSFGYISGPSATQVLDVSSVSNGSGSLSSETKVQFLRYLLEAEKRWPWGLKIGAGAGAANGRARISSSGTGIFSATDGRNKNWTGFTWEATVSGFWRLPVADVEIGTRYAHLPGLGETDTNVKIKWDTLGAFVGVMFGGS